METVSRQTLYLLRDQSSRRRPVTLTEHVAAPTAQHHQHPRWHLFCFPYAGGSSSVFNGWVTKLPLDLWLWGAEYAGRGKRWAVAPCTSIESIVEEFTHIRCLGANDQFVLFGYSLGAVVAFELALNLRDHFGIEPACLIVLSAKAPHILRGGPLVGELSDAQLIDRLRNLNGTAEELLQDEGMMDLLLPFIRADLLAYETYRARPNSVLHCPIVTIKGVEDRLVLDEDIAPWKDCTRGRYFSHTLPGGHFSHLDAVDELMEVLTATMKNLLPPASPLVRAQRSHTAPSKTSKFVSR